MKVKVETARTVDGYKIAAELNLSMLDLVRVPKFIVDQLGELLENRAYSTATRLRYLADFIDQLESPDKQTETLRRLMEGHGENAKRAIDLG